MTYMIKIISALIIISVFHGCSYISYSQVIPLAKTAIIGVDDIELTNELDGFKSLCNTFAECIYFRPRNN